jgi:hypothetical protein
MTFYESLGQHPVVWVLLAAIAGTLVYEIIRLFMRTANIRKHGWPPAGYDADGDPVEPKDKDKDE